MQRIVLSGNPQGTPARGKATARHVNRRLDSCAVAVADVRRNIDSMKPAGAKIRVFEQNDVRAAAALFARVYPEQRWHSQSACEAYFHEILFDNPWRDLEIPSWVAEENGRLSGFYAVLPRRMLLHGKPIRVAAACQFMVDPENRNSLTALQLTQACLSGPQDLTLADGASAQARHMWGAIGGTSALLYSLHWTRLLRPARYALSLMEGVGAIARPLAPAVRPLCAAADALAARLPPNRFLRTIDDCTEQALDAATMSFHVPGVMDATALQPVYDSASLTWLLQQAARKKRHGALRSRAVFDARHKLIGWYLYYLKDGGVGEVVQIAALKNGFDRVLQRLLADAWNNGASALRGRLDPRFVQELSDRHCWMRRDDSWTLFHSRHAGIASAIERGDAFLSRLDGEWWLRFQGG